VEQSATNSTYVSTYGGPAGQPVSGFRPILGTAFYGAQVPVTNLDGTALVVTSSKPLAVQAYGFARFDAYGFPGGLNTAPVVAVPDAFSCGGSGARVDVLANDICVIRNDVSLSIPTQPANGTASVNATDNTITYTPNNSNFNGNDSFVYQITENGLSSTALVRMWVNNRNPVANPVAATAIGANPALINIINSDSDPDGDPLTILGVGSPGNGVVWLNSPGKTVTYACTNSATSDSFTYTITDGRGGSATGVVTVTIQQ
jgi:hypothetical protein